MGRRCCPCRWSAFISRLFWAAGGPDRRTRDLARGFGVPSLAIAAFTTTQDEAGLFAISAAYGLGFSGIVPAYVVAIRELFLSAEASWRVPTLLFVSMSGMAFGRPAL